MDEKTENNWFDVGEKTENMFVQWKTGTNGFAVYEETMNCVFNMNDEPYCV